MEAWRPGPSKLVQCLVGAQSDKSYKRECQETYLAVGSVLILFCLSIQRRNAACSLWFHILVFEAPFVF